MESKDKLFDKYLLKTVLVFLSCLLLGGVVFLISKHANVPPAIPALSIVVLALIINHFVNKNKNKNKN